MRTLIVGAGPAGLYLAYLLKRRRPEWSIRVVEQNARGSTFGFGVVFSERALGFLRGDDPETYDLITPRMESWTDLTLVHRATAVVIDGIGFAAIGRLTLLQLMQQRLASVAVVPEYEKTIERIAERAPHERIGPVRRHHQIVAVQFFPSFNGFFVFRNDRHACQPLLHELQ